MKHMCPQNRDLVLQFYRSSVIKRSTFLLILIATVKPTEAPD